MLHFKGGAGTEHHLAVNRVEPLRIQLKTSDLDTIEGMLTDDDGRTNEAVLGTASPF